MSLRNLPAATLLICLVALLWDLVVATFGIVAESAPYLFIGFFIAGLLKVLIPEEWVRGKLGKNDFRSVGLASFFGVPIPLCSCSVIPTAMALRRGGASKGATTSFLISTPETGVDSIGITYALMDPFMTVIRPLAALGTALATGSLVNLAVRWKFDDSPAIEVPEEATEHDHGHEHAHEHDHGDAATTEGADGWRATLTQANRYAFGTLFDDLTPSFIVGFVLSGVIALAFPADFFDTMLPSLWMEYALMLVIGTPTYICAAAATPLAAALIAKGLDPGAALVMLLAGPATNVTTMIVVYRYLGRRILAIYLVGVTACALAIGAWVGNVYRASGIDLRAIVEGALVEGPSVVGVVAGFALLGMLALSARRIGLLQRCRNDLLRGMDRAGIRGGPTVPRIAGVLLVVSIVAVNCLTIVGPGESAWVLRFGRIEREITSPGVYAHLPYPVDEVVRMPANLVRSVEVPVSFGNDGFVLTGDESLLSIGFTVHYDVVDPGRYLFGLSAPDTLVQAVAESALRQAAATRPSSELLVENWAAIEAGSRDRMQQALDRLDAGVRVRDVILASIHAPDAVHPAFREVASALEDKERLVELAHAYAVRALADANAESARSIESARAYESTMRNEVAGDHASFLERLAAYRDAPRLTRVRLYLEAIEAALERSRTVIVLGEDVEVDLVDMGGAANARELTALLGREEH